MNEEFNKRAKKIIDENVYFTIATASESGNPWVSPLWGVHDSNYNFYWGSPSNTKHSGFLRENPRSAVVIFDSKAPEGTGEGVYFEGKAYEIIDEVELRRGIKLLFPQSKPISDFIGNAPRRLYKFIPEKAWINAGDEVNGYFEDHRVELDIL